MTEQWQELKETIIEMRDNDGTGSQQETCKFLANYMEILEKQMQEPCEDCISRQAVLDQTYLWSKDEFLRVTNPFDYLRKRINSLPSVTPQRPKGKWIFHKPFDDGHKNCNECIECNQCHTWLGYDCYAKTPYCPNCGAIMSGGGEDG